MGTEIGQLGGYGFQGAIFGVDGSGKDGKMGSGCCKFQGEEADKCARVDRGRHAFEQAGVGGSCVSVAVATLSEGVLQDPTVVISRARFLFLLHNHIINIKKKSFSGEVKDSVMFPFYFLLHKRDNPASPPYIHPSAHLSTHSSTHSSTHPSTHPSAHPSICPPIRPYLGNVAKLIRRRRISLKRDNHPPKKTKVKSMAARFEQKISFNKLNYKPTQVLNVTTN
jgi:hypothetical protein